MSTKAEKARDRYIINGSKCFISNGPIANLISLFAMTDPSKGVHGISAIIVETDTPGFSVAKWESKLGIKGSPTGELVFENMEVPAENLIGDEGKGFIAGRRRCASGGRGIWIHDGVSIRTDDEGRQDYPDLRGNEPDPETGDIEGAAEVGYAAANAALFSIRRQA
jgi:Acyl-CoA dehydrogenase, middle domain